MKILVIADPHLPIPPRRYGGTERIAYLLCRELSRVGHSVRLVAAKGSQDFGGGVVVHTATQGGFLARGCRKAWFQVLLAGSMRGIDAVINFGRLDYPHVAFHCRQPFVTWFQNPVRQVDIDYLNRHRPLRRCAIFISSHQAKHLTNVGPYMVAPNAVDTVFFGFSERAADPPYFVFLGRLTANKGVHLAIGAARRAGVRLKLAGNISNEPGGQDYFETRVKPELGGDCEWVGEVDDEQKRVLLQGATALVFPIQWDEPFGIVMIESLACGTPVVALKRASTPEVVEAGKTGLLCDRPEDLALALQQVHTISRSECRKAAVEQFGARVLLRNALEALKRAGA